jgi:hypothetical protein
VRSPPGMEHGMTMRKGRSAPPVLILLLSLSFPPAALCANEPASTKDYNKPYTFTQNWFTDRIPTWTQALKEFKGRPNLNYLEIGTFEGRSALWVLENIATHPASKITVIDVFHERNYKTFVSNIKLSGGANRFRILKGMSTEKLREVPFNSVDFAYVDGSAKGITMLSDFVSTWDLVKVGGIMILSRYTLTAFVRKAFELQPGDPGPHEAIDAFLTFYKPYIGVEVFKENQVIVRKTRQ